MLHVAICDDEENEIEYLKYAVEDWAKKEAIGSGFCIRNLSLCAYIY